MSEIEASLFGCIAILPRLTNLSHGNRWPVHSEHWAIFTSQSFSSIFLICRVQHSRKLGLSRSILCFFMWFFYFKQHLQKSKLTIANGYLWPKNWLYKWFFFIIFSNYVDMGIKRFVMQILIQRSKRFMQLWVKYVIKFSQNLKKKKIKWRFIYFKIALD